MKNRVVIGILILLNLLLISVPTVILLKRGTLSYILWRLQLGKEGFHRPFPGSASYANRRSQFTQLPITKGEIIFLGDSLIEQGSWNELFGIPTIRNRGIGGEHTSSLMGRLEEVVGREPKKLFIMIGTNDLGRNVPIGVLVDHYEKMITHIQSASPHTEIYIHSLLPVRGQWEWKRDNADIREVNRQLVLLAKKRRCTYVDLFSSFIDEKGELREDLSFDGLHLNGPGYLLWKKKIERYVSNVSP